MPFPADTNHAGWLWFSPTTTSQGKATTKETRHDPVTISRNLEKRLQNQHFPDNLGRLYAGMMYRNSGRSSAQ
jgi:hypothetical protein